MKPSSINIMVIVAAVVLAVIGVVISDHWMSSPKPMIHEPVVQFTKPAPDLHMADINGRSHALQDLRGKAVILNFWASWCAPCRVEMPQLFDLAATHKDDLVLVLISVDNDRAAIERFFTQAKLKVTDNIVVVHDPRKAISKDVFGTLRYPESILIDRRGMMVEKIAGAVDWTQQDLGMILLP